MRAQAVIRRAAPAAVTVVAALRVAVVDTGNGTDADARLTSDVDEWSGTWSVASAARSWGRCQTHPGRPLDRRETDPLEDLVEFRAIPERCQGGIIR